MLLASATEGTGILLLAAIDRRRPSAGDPHPTVAIRDPGSGPVELRPLVAADERVLYGIFRTAVDDLVRATARVASAFDLGDDAEWERWRPVFEHIRATADLAWGAESDGGLVGYARSIRRGDDQELTEFFVLPEAQGRGIGARLLERAFPADAHHPSISPAPTLPRCRDICDWGSCPRPRSTCSRVHRQRIRAAAGRRGRAAAGRPAGRRPDGCARRHRRGGPRHAPRCGPRVARGAADRLAAGARGAPVGYAYGGPRQGPVAVLDPSLLVGAVGLLEAEAMRRGEERIVWVSLAGSGDLVRYVLGRGYRIDPDPLYLLEDPPRVRADRYVVMSPPFHL